MTGREGANGHSEKARRRAHLALRRLARRLGFAPRNEPRLTELALTRLLPPERWNAMHFLLIAHGREVCSSQRPLCDSCLLEDLCPRQGLRR